MRPFLGGLLVLGSVFCLAGGPEPKSEESSGAVWRRTATGWENMLDWRIRPESYHPTLHPSTVAGFQLLACLLVLVAWDRTGFRKPSHGKDLRSEAQSFEGNLCTESRAPQHYYSQPECLVISDLELLPCV